jgi:hypothetical protein
VTSRGEETERKKNRIGWLTCGPHLAVTEVKVGSRPAGSVGRQAKWAGGLSRPVEKEGGPLEDFSSGLRPKLKRKLFLISYKP